jgi:hypothetical protein
MDNLVQVVMGAHDKARDPNARPRSRFGMGLCVLYFLLCAIALDTTLQPHWAVNSKLSTEKLVDAEHAREVARNSEM